MILLARLFQIASNFCVNLGVRLLKMSGWCAKRAREPKHERFTLREKLWLTKSIPPSKEMDAVVAEQQAWERTHA